MSLIEVGASYILPEGTLLYRGTQVNPERPAKHPRNNLNLTINPELAIHYVKDCLNIYSTRRPLNLLDIDQAGLSREQNAYLLFLLGHLGVKVPFGENQQDILRNNLGVTGFDGYKWISHEGEIVVHLGSDLVFVEQIVIENSTDRQETRERFANETRAAKALVRELTNETKARMAAAKAAEETTPAGKKRRSKRKSISRKIRKTKEKKNRR
jgi:hypothetical protein